MIVVKIELWKKGDPEDVELIGVMRIFNTGKHPDHPMKGDYEARILRAPSFNRITRASRLENWPRLQKTIWHMLGHLLRDMGYTK